MNKFSEYCLLFLLLMLHIMIYLSVLGNKEITENQKVLQKQIIKSCRDGKAE